MAKAAFRMASIYIIRFAIETQKCPVIAPGFSIIAQKAQVGILQGNGWEPSRLCTFEGAFEERAYFLDDREREKGERGKSVSERGNTKTTDFKITVTQSLLNYKPAKSWLLNCIG